MSSTASDKLNNGFLVTIQVATIPAFMDNYLWVVHDHQFAIVIDPGDATPIIDHLTKHNLTLVAILCTHHHADHVGGVAALLDFYALNGKIPVYGPANEIIPKRTVALTEADAVEITALNLKLNVIDVPGHTTGQIAYYAAAQSWLFCGDTLFACGCGRLLGGTAQQAQSSLAKLKALPPNTQVFCAHEYTLANIKFAEAVEPENMALKARKARDVAKREHGIATVPFTIQDELECNPFLRWDSPAVIAAAIKFQTTKFQKTKKQETQTQKIQTQLGRGLASINASKPPPDIVFSEIREWKNTFK